MNHECEFACNYHNGPVEWHHPISWAPEVGCYLCQLHHSLVQGRKTRHPKELLDDRPLETIRMKVIKFVIGKVKDAGYSKYDIDKN